MPRAQLSKAGAKLRDQINKEYPKRKKDSDGWIGDKKHVTQKSDHNPDPKTGIVRALDIDADLAKNVDSWELAEAIRQAAKNGDKRISYIIHKGKIANGSIGLWIWRAYKGQNPHNTHLHVSFTKTGDTDGKAFEINFPKPKTKQEKIEAKPAKQTLCPNCTILIKKLM
jgi:predicted ATP-dependent protease